MSERTGTERAASLARPGAAQWSARPVAVPQTTFVVAARASPESGPENLPTQLTSFVGRDTEQAELRALIGERRLVTVAGPGGSGKTRLALRAAADEAHRWPDGVCWVDLGDITDPALIPRALAVAVRAVIDPLDDPLRALASQLRDRHVLVCLDTCEHLLEPCAELVATVLRACPNVTVLATSRERLGVPGEAVWRVPPLASPDAARLFGERAELAGYGVADDDVAADVASICARLDGLPLAIELAAGWTRVISPREIASRLDNRFRLLVGGPRVVADRHQALSASITWSHDLLDAFDQIGFRRLGVFVGEFDLDAAVAVCGEDPDAVLDTVGRLVDKSLVTVLHPDRDGARYRLLDTIRAYAVQRLGVAEENRATRDRHLDHFLAFAEAAESELDRDQDVWRDIIEKNHDNLRAALRWGLRSDDPRRGRRLAASLARFWFVQGNSHEGLGFLDQALERGAGERSTVQARLFAGAGLVATGGAQPRRAADAARHGLEIAVEVGDEHSRGRCLIVEAFRMFFVDFRASHQLALRARQAGDTADDAVAVDWSWVLEASALTNQDRHADAVAAAQVVHRRCVERGRRSCAAFARSAEVWAALFTGDVRLAEELSRDALRLAEPLGDHFTVGLMAFNVAWATGLGGDLDAAHLQIEAVLRAVTAAGPEVELRPWLAIIPGKLRLWSGDAEGALAWFEAASRFAEPMTDNSIVARALPGFAETQRRLARHDRARELAELARELALTLGMPHVHAEALDELGFLATEEDDLPAAAARHRHAMDVRVEQGLRTFVADSLDAIAGLAARTGRAEAALRLAAASTVARAAMGYPRPPVRVPDHEATLCRARSALGEDSAARAELAGARMTLDEAVAYAGRLRSPRGRPSSGWGSLTPAEREVVDLVVEGLSNPEIAARLFMSRATVKTHLSHVYSKLGVTNRTALATVTGRRPTAPGTGRSGRDHAPQGLRTDVTPT